MIQTPPLTFRRINPSIDGPLCFSNYRDAAIATFGPSTQSAHPQRYLPWLRSRVEEFPDGHVLAFLNLQCVGQLELQVPYGSDAAYINLFYVTPHYRQQGFGRRLHEYVEQYARSWDAHRIELDVSSTNDRAIGFYKHLGYHFTEGGFLPLIRMIKPISP
ncbi:MAG TPA: GNAT family N-acetyltransferase [Tepidisphaeraceae bacterium]|jgi:ribosomal protein S18 acetylase RimI-like enzyme|nr:GNAT family N-acetyltransferase [Tepidisphaeraceae bacterium]